MDIVYEASSIATLTRALVSAIHERADVTGASTPTVLSDLAEQYLLALPRRPGPSELVERRTDAKIVLVTGTTGGFGADLLEHLLLDDSVETVYALNRKGTSAVERQTTRFHHRGLQVSLLASPKLKMVEGDLSSRGLGLPAQTLDEVSSQKWPESQYAPRLTFATFLEIKRSTTHILHNGQFTYICACSNADTNHTAWRVNFKLALASFETELAGLRNLIEVALSSPYTVPPKLQFVSSIGVFRGETPATLFDTLSAHQCLRLSAFWADPGGACPTVRCPRNRLLRVQVDRGRDPLQDRREGRCSRQRRSSRTAMWRSKGTLERERMVPCNGQIKPPCRLPSRHNHCMGPF